MKRNMNTKSQQPRLDEVGVIALAPDPWGRQWMDRHYLMSRLADYFQVLWLYQPGWQESLSAMWRPGVVSAAAEAPRPEALQVYEPESWLPRLGRPASIARMTSRERLKRACERLRARGCKKIVFFVCRPELADGLEHGLHDFGAYYVSDEYSFSAKEVPVPPAERDVLKAAGVVFLTSPALMEKRGAFNPNTHFIPMGVDFQKFATPVPEPEDLRNIPHPRIGYVGHLKNVLDWPLLLELSDLHPEWSFIFVGPRRPHPEIDEVLRQMDLRPNVHFLGGKPTEILGAYPQHFDVCLMPYRLDDYTKYVYPLKMHEYLASGRPVVSSGIRSVEDFRHVVSIASGREEWSNAIERALSPEENTAELRAERQSVAHEFDWGPLAHRVAAAIAKGVGIELPDQPAAAGSEPAAYAIGQLKIPLNQ
jgi:glycosyltransferase involved in cell wall biosynthesis